MSVKSHRAPGGIAGKSRIKALTRKSAEATLRERLYSHDYNSAKVFYFLLQMAHLFFQLMVAGSLFKKYFPRGFGSLRNFAERLREAWRNSLLHEQVLDLLDQLRFQIRFDTS